MKKFSIYLILLLYFGLYFKSNAVPPTQIANYSIKAELFPEEKIIKGEEELTWTNTSNTSINELQFHLYLNAFKNRQSTFMKESNGGSLRSNDFDDSKKENFGNIKIDKFNIKGGVSLLDRIKFIHPDDNNSNDETVISVRLFTPIKPGETITLLINFTSKLPKIFARTGFEKDYFLVGQWFPKIGVYENARGWNCHQFHAHTEFYADFGSYNVQIVCPKDYLIAATGLEQNRLSLKDDKVSYTFKADKVHDFAWAASKNFKEFEYKRKNTRIKIMMQKLHSSQVERYKNSLFNAMDYFENKLGLYPHPSLVIIDPPSMFSGSAGMEYPMFITTGTVFGLPNSIKAPEMVTVHEFGHQYFQGILASNEFEESFMDEGFNQYFETRIIDYYYKGIYGSNGLNFSDINQARTDYTSLENKTITPIVNKAWEYPKGTYGTMSYTKTAIALKTLEQIVGESVMDFVMKKYYENYKFKHPYFKDFVSTFNEYAPGLTNSKFGSDFNWYFDQAFYGTEVCDYAVDSLQETSFRLKNLGTMVLPLDVSIEFVDGSTRSIFIKALEKEMIQKTEKPIKSVRIKTLMLDTNFENNSINSKKDSEGAFDVAIILLNQIQNLLVGFSKWFV